MYGSVQYPSSEGLLLRLEQFIFSTALLLGNIFLVKTKQNKESKILEEIKDRVLSHQSL